MAAEHPAQPHREPVRKPDENLSPQSGAPIVDPSPTAPPIRLGDTEYKFPPAPASPKEVLALEPHRYDDATDGPDEQISSIRYVTWNRPDNGSFIAPIANDETYERKGFVRGAEQDIPDLVAYLEDQGKSEHQRETEKRAREARERHDEQRREREKANRERNVSEASRPRAS